MKSKYTKDLLAPLVKSSFSVQEVMRKLGHVTFVGGVHSYVSLKIRQSGLSTKHFLGRAANRGAGHAGGPEKLLWREVLVQRRCGGRREDIKRLRRAMIESGIKHECSSCGLPPQWNGKALCLQVEHKDGDCLNNERKNLCFLCPNCHSQTDTFGSLNIRSRRSGGVKVAAHG